MNQAWHVRIRMRIITVFVLALIFDSCSLDVAGVFGPTGIVQSHPPRLLNHFPFTEGLNDVRGDAELLFSDYATLEPTVDGTAVSFAPGLDESVIDGLLPLVQYRLSILPSEFSISFWTESIAAATHPEDAYPEMLIAVQPQLSDPTSMQTYGNETSRIALVSTQFNATEWDDGANYAQHPLSVSVRHQTFFSASGRSDMPSLRYLIVITYDAEDITRIYINGELVETTRNQTVAMAVPAEPVWVVVGWTQAGTDVMDAGLFVDDLRFYEGALRHDDVRALFEEGPQ